MKKIFFLTITLLYFQPCKSQVLQSYKAATDYVDRFWEVEVKDSAVNCILISGNQSDLSVAYRLLSVDFKGKVRSNTFCQDDFYPVSNNKNVIDEGDNYISFGRSNSNDSFGIKNLYISKISALKECTILKQTTINSDSIRGKEPILLKKLPNNKYFACSNTYDLVPLSKRKSNFYILNSNLDITLKKEIQFLNWKYGAISSIVYTPDNHLIAVRRVWNKPYIGDIKFDIAKYDTLGNEIWAKEIDAVAEFYYKDKAKLQIIDDSTFAFTYIQDTFIEHIVKDRLNIKWVVFNAQGVVKCNKTLFKNVDNFTRIADVLRTSDNNFVAVGEITDSAKLYLTSSWIFKFNIEGDIIWNKKYRSFGSDETFDELQPFEMVRELPNQSLVLATAKYDSIGFKDWESNAALLFLDKNGCFYKNKCEDNQIIRIYPQSQPTSNEDVNVNSQVVLSPNPATSNLQIKLKTTDFQNGTFFLYDTQGSLTATYPLLSNHDEYRFDISNLANEMYFWHLVLDDKVRQTGKVVVIKE